MRHHARAAGTEAPSPFLDVTMRLLEEGLSVRFRANGSSMRPAIEDGDLITVGPVGEDAIRPGDVILYRRGRRPIAHRVQRVVVDADGAVAVVARGDGKAADDAPVALDQVLGRVVAVEACRSALARRLARVRRLARLPGEILLFCLGVPGGHRDADSRRGCAGRLTFGIDTR